MKSTLIYLLLITSFLASSQTQYPTDYFRKPLDIPLILSGTFGELRSNHFHSGLDLKTQQREGLKVYTAAAGYVSRIKISHWGYGKAIYITHPNGYTTVYAHLKKFNSRIEKYVKKHQYEKKDYEIQLFPSSDELPISKDEVIAYSGSTGGYVGPHLHFEIRDSKNSKPINPMFFGIDIKDSKNPTITNLIAYSLADSSHVNNSEIPIQLSIKQIDKGNLKADKITAYGKIGFGVNTYDRLDGANNKNGIYSLEMLQNGKQVYKHTVEKFSFAESKYINLLIDYERYGKLNQRVQQCFKEDYNPLSIYNNVVDNGVLTIDNDLSYTVEIIAKDFKGNTTNLKIPIQGKKDEIRIKKEIDSTDYFIKNQEFNKFSKNGVTVAFPKNTFYNDFYFDFKVTDKNAYLHKPTVVVNKNFTLTFDVSKYTDEMKKQLFIAKYNSKGHPRYSKTVKKETTFYTTTKSLGKYSLLTDNQKPKVSLFNFKDKQWLSKYRYLKVKVSDDLSGINSYYATINNEWILMEYNIKQGLLIYDFNDKELNGSSHDFKIVVKDNVGNTKTLSATFFKK